MAWTWKRTLAGGAAVVAAVGTIALLGAFAGHGCGRHGHDPAQVAAFVSARVDDALDDLDATPAQREKIHAVKDRLLADATRLHESHAGDRGELVAQWDAAQPDAAKLHALVDARVDEMRKLAHEAVDSAIEVHGILTPEQRAKVSKKVHRHVDVEAQ
jgi:Spy/CpxP family protein refolding chaperone